MTTTPRHRRRTRFIARAAAAGIALLGGCRAEPPSPAPEAPPAEKPATGLDSPALEAPPAGAPASPELAARIADVRALPARAESWVELGRAWVRTARLAQREDLYRRAAAAADEALKRAPGNREAQHLQALVARVGHRFAEIRRIATALTTSDPRDATAWGLMADAALELGDMPAAEQAVDRMLELSPALPAFSRAAWLRWLHGDVDGGLEMWGEALRASGRRDPEPRAFVLTEIGHLQWHRGRLDEAEKAYRLALEALPKHAGALFGLGRVKLARGDAAGAAEDLAASNAARLSELTAEWQALALRAAGEVAEADALDAKLAAAGAFDDPRTVALYLAHRSIEPETAVARARADFEQRHDVYSHDALGFALLRAGRLDEAATHLEAATALGTPDPTLMAHRGLLEKARGREAEARTWLDRAWNQNPHAHPRLMAEVAAARGAPAAQEPR